MFWLLAKICCKNLAILILKKIWPQNSFLCVKITIFQIICPPKNTSCMHFAFSTYSNFLRCFVKLHNVDMSQDYVNHIVSTDFHFIQ